MKQYFKYILLAMITSLLLVGCGEGDLKEPTYNVELKSGEKTTVYPGDTLVPADDRTVINVIHTLDEDIKEVEIILGSATLLRGNYEITQ